MKLKKALLIPDCHRPWHHKRAYNLMLKVAKDICVDEIYLLGDYADFYCVSSHQKDPRVGSMIDKEINDVVQGLDEIDSQFPHAKKTYIVGNHEHRLERFVLNNASQLFGYVDLVDLLGLRERPKWSVIPYSPNQKVQIGRSKLYARHEPLSSSAKATATRALCSVVYGHIHKIEESHIVGMDGTNHVAFSVGWLGDKRKDLVFGYVKSQHQWQMGFGLVYIDPKSRYFYHHKVHILDNVTCVVNGKLYKP